MKGAALAIMCACGIAPNAECQVVAAGTTMTVRTMDRFDARASSRSALIRAQVLDPVYQGNRVLIAPGTRIEGVIADAGVHKSRALRTFIRVQFSSLVVSDSQRLPISALVTDVDNAMESVDSTGVIVGPPLTASVRRVAFEAGTDMTIRLLSEVTLPAWPDFRLPEPFGTDSAVRALIDSIPLRALSLNGRLPGGIVNMLLVGGDSDVTQAFESAGWTTPDRLSARSTLHTFFRAAEGRGYAHQPVSSQTMFGRPPDFVFQRITDNYAKRHHVRIWRTAQTWDGVPVWALGASHDVGVTFSARRKGFTHRTDPYIDDERDKIVGDMLFARAVARQSLVPRAPQPETKDVRTDWRVAVMLLLPARADALSTSRP